MRYSFSMQFPFYPLNTHGINSLIRSQTKRSHARFNPSAFHTIPIYSIGLSHARVSSVHAATIRDHNNCYQKLNPCWWTQQSFCLSLAAIQHQVHTHVVGYSYMDRFNLRCSYLLEKRGNVTNSCWAMVTPFGISKVCLALTECLAHWTQTANRNNWNKTLFPREIFIIHFFTKFQVISMFFRPSSIKQSIRFFFWSSALYGITWFSMRILFWINKSFVLLGNFDH